MIPLLVDPAPMQPTAIEARSPAVRSGLIATASATVDGRCARLLIELRVSAALVAVTGAEGGGWAIDLTLAAPSREPTAEDIAIPEAARLYVAQARMSTTTGTAARLMLQPPPGSAVTAAVEGSRVVATICPAVTAEAPALARAEKAIVAGQLKDAAALLLEAAQTDPAARPHALELTGVIEERLGQIEAARATFQDYLTRFAGTAGADRVGQRLAALTPAARHAPSTEAAPATATTSVSVHGSLAQFYLRDRSRSVFRDALRPQAGEQVDVRDNVDELLSTLAFDAKIVTPGWTLSARFDGGHVSEYRPVTLVGGDRGQGSYSLLSESLVTAQRTGNGLRLDLGRQWRLGNGVLGRFDGGAVTIPVSAADGIEAVAGFPIWSSRQTSVDTGKWFYGLAWARHHIAPGVDAKLYWFDQYAAGRPDRRAIGVEAQASGKRVSGSMLLDFDLGFGTISSFVLRAETRLTPANTLGIEIQRLHFPTLALDNAAIGQPTPTLSAVAATLSMSDLRRLARDRTTRWDSATVTWSHYLGGWGELVTDATLSRLSASPASGGVFAFPGSGLEAYGGVQLIATRPFGAGSTVSVGLRGATVQGARIVTLDAAASFHAPLGFRLSPQVRFAHRQNNGATGWQDVFQPAMRVVHPLAARGEIEVQAGGNLLWQRYAGADLQGRRHERAFIVHLGYRLVF